MSEEDRNEDDEWSELWDARLAALEKALGPSDDKVLHGVIPFQFGREVGGSADINMFSNHVDGIVYVTADLIGNEDQKPNSMGNYELMICHRDAQQWGPWIIGQLAHYTLDTELNPGETMSLGDGVPEGSTIEALLFVDYGRFDVLGKQAGLLLCLGLTGPEVESCQESGSDGIVAKLKSASVYPFTDLNRESVV